MKQVGTFDRVPKVYPEIRQCGVVIKASPNLAEARKFMTWLTSKKVQENLPKFGLDPAN
jgi:molybdate transport system substrate-binding protein